MRLEKKILLLVPAPSARGGITNYYYSLLKHLPNRVEYFVRGARNWPYRSSALKEFSRLTMDVLRFIAKLFSFRYSVIQTSTSLGMMSVYRDGLFLKLGSLFGLKTIVFFRGWNPKVEEGIVGWKLRLFKYFFFSSDHIIVLSTYVDNKLHEWGYEGKITRETTLVEDEYIGRLPKESILRSNQDPVKTMLFLGRIEKTKGIFELLEAFKIAAYKHPKISLIYAGDGRDEEELKRRVDEFQLKNVCLIGYVESEKKSRTLQNADIYAFPSYTEGMPNSVLEAMAYGLPVFTRPVGGVPDVVENGVNGVLESSLDPTIIADHLIWMIEHPAELAKMSEANYKKAKELFWSSTVANRMMSIYEEVLKRE